MGAPLILDAIYGHHLGTMLPYDHVRPLHAHHRPEHKLKKGFGPKFYVAQASYDWTPTYNAAPLQMLPIIRKYNATRLSSHDGGPLAGRVDALEALTRDDQRPPCSRLHSAAATASFSRTAIEWKTVGKHKQPYRITLKAGELFAMAGIYAREPTEFDTAEKNPVNSPPRPTKHSATFTTECLSSCRSAARRNGCRPLQPARTSSRPSAPILTSYPVTPK